MILPFVFDLDFDLLILISCFWDLRFSCLAHQNPCKQSTEHKNRPTTKTQSTSFPHPFFCFYFFAPSFLCSFSSSLFPCLQKQQTQSPSTHQTVRLAPSLLSLYPFILESPSSPPLLALCLASFQAQLCLFQPLLTFFLFSFLNFLRCSLFVLLPPPLPLFFFLVPLFVVFLEPLDQKPFLLLLRVASLFLSFFRCLFRCLFCFVDEDV